MSEIKFFELKCQRCGGELERKEEQGAEIYVCKSCGKTFEKQIVSDVADELNKILNEQKQEAVANLRRQLWAEMHEQFINSEKIVELSREIKKYLPDDYFANFCEIANSGNDRQVNAFLRETSKENMADYADVVLDFMLKSVNASNLNAISLFIERAFKGDTQNYDKYITRYEDEAQKVSSGIYELTLTRNVFLAYSSKDIDKVLELCDYLERNKITCFLALRNLRHGRGAVDNYDKALKTAIDNCQTVVFVSSNNSRDMTCDALIKELPYIKKKDFENAPPECKRNYYKIPTDVLMPRVQYLIEDYKNDGSVAEGIVDEFFHDLEWCRSKEEVARRVSDYLTSDHETTAQKAEREKREAEQKLEEERRKAKELELRIAEMQVNATAHADSAKTTKSDNADGITQETFNGKKLCKKCKKSVNLTAKFCPDCGSNSFFTTYEEYLASKIKFCSMCGAQNNAEDKFCAECGSTKFVPTEKDYRDLAEKRKEEERQRKLREEEERKRAEEVERKRREEEEAERKRKAEEKRKKEEEERSRIKKRRRNKFIASGIVLALVAVFCVSISLYFSLAPLSTVMKDNMTFTKNDDGYYSLSNYTGSDTSVEIPSSVRGVVVTEISERAFYNCDTLTSITIPDSITSIDSYAFCNCKSLITIAVPESVTAIGSSAFGGCASLESITLPFVGESVSATSASSSTLFGYIFGVSSYSGGTATKQYYSTSDYCTYHIPATLTTITITGGDIYYGAFYNCATLKDITIGDNVTSIGTRAFCGCSSLESMTLPFVGKNTSVTSGVTALFGYIFGENSYTGGNETTQYYSTGTTVAYINYYIPATLTTVTITDGDITDYAFFHCSMIENITIGDNVTKIGSEAFTYCFALVNINIGQGVKAIGNSAFWNCSALTEITIPDNVETIGSSAFTFCTSLESVTLSNSLTEISDSLFIDCHSLTSIIIPENVISIGRFSFCYCTSLTDITISNSVTSIGEVTFSGCSSLESITIPDSVTSIGRGAFDECESLKSVTLKNTSGWYVSTESGASSGTSVTVTNASTNATLFFSTYCSYYWYRK